MNLKDMCRTCLYSGVPMYPLFETPIVGSGAPPASELLNTFTEIMITRNDRYPDTICMVCLSEINRSYAFKLQCERSETTLQEYCKDISLFSKGPPNLNGSYPSLPNAITVENENEFSHAISPNIDQFRDSEESYYTVPGEPVFCEGFTIEEIDENEMELNTNRTWKPEFDEDNSYDTMRYDFKTYPDESYMDLYSTNQPESREFFSCEYCPMQFALIAQYREHVFEHTGQNEFQCKVCSQIHNSKIALKHHERVHTGEKPFRCDKCGQRFQQNHSLKKHVATHYSRRAVKCTVCYMKFKDNYGLTRHLREQHCNMKLYACQYCPLKFKRNDQLKKHIFEHTGNHKFKCDICYVALWDRKHQIEHMRIHTGEKPFQCEICYKNFRLKRVYERHKKAVHQTPNDLRCSLCPSSFKLVCNLKRHINETHLEQAYNGNGASEETLMM